ncbi:MAG TPA: hypothetical protein VFS00_26665, partial [Polyangiaceae bacterium]|nr:hypothetical protein [Polyangiaceae bacterium]
MRPTLMARSFFVAPLLLLSLAWARDARAGDAPAFSELPVGRFSAPPTKSPGHIAAGERAPGIFVVSQKFPPQVPRASRYVTIVGDAKAAEAMR